ncbi:hypothetical protein M5K25_015956 [Dendrobium thyrsiflorum]|uniref:FAR1 domain-containing protein n=1 Tax=Dendrobium thyrsiflorum TaxID=117978 RepID=A0ABD0USJ5_DENTH
MEKYENLVTIWESEHIFSQNIEIEERMKCSEEISQNIEIEERMKCSEEIDIEDRGNDFQKSEVNFTGTAEGFNISMQINCTFSCGVARSLRFYCATTALLLRYNCAFTVAYKDEKEAYEAYCSYAHNNRFSVRKDHHSFLPNSRKIKTKDFVCSKAGFKKQSDLNSQNKCRRSETRTGCPCLIRFSVDEDGNWIVKKFIESYNHYLARLEDRHLLRSGRNIDDERASVLKSITEAGIRTVDAFSYLADEVGCVENLGFLKMDAYNFIQKEKRSKIEFGDTNVLIQLFKDRQVGYGCLGKGTDSGSGFIFRNHISRFAYQISIRAQGNELAEQYMLGAMKDMAENIYLLVEGKMTNSNFIAKSKSRAAPVSAFKDPQKRRLKGISNARLKGYWEKKKQKSKLYYAFTALYLRFNCTFIAL